MAPSVAGELLMTDQVSPGYRAAAIVVALVSAIALFGFVPCYPLWALIIIALDVAVIRAIAAHGGDVDVGRCTATT
jgi:hypothetical protein